MKLVSVNRGSAQALEFGNRSFVTGIAKQAVACSSHVSATGLVDDTICNQEHHGGPDQAIYAYGAESYAWWSEKLDTTLEPGTFGDNLTIAGLPDDMIVGDRLLIGEVMLEATGPRIPCSTLAARMGDQNFGIHFRRAERPGFYFRVLNEGDVQAGDNVSYVENPDNDVSIVEVFRLYYELKPAADVLRRVLDAPIAERLRHRFESKLDSAD